jgi:hypothetical protein
MFVRGMERNKKIKRCRKNVFPERLILLGCFCGKGKREREERCSNHISR